MRVCIIAIVALDGMRLDQGTTTSLISYIQAQGSFPDQFRLIAATVLKNKIKQVYGVSNHCEMWRILSLIIDSLTHSFIATLIFALR